MKTNPKQPTAVSDRIESHLKLRRRFVVRWVKARQCVASLTAAHDLPRPRADGTRRVSTAELAFQSRRNAAGPPLPAVGRGKGGRDAPPSSLTLTSIVHGRRN